MNTVFSIFAAALCGALSGYGIGGGTLLLVYMTTFAALPQHTAQGINLLYFIPASLGALYFHLKNGLVDKKAALPTALSGLVFAALGAFTANSMDPDKLRSVFGVFLILTGLVVFFKKSHK